MKGSAACFLCAAVLVAAVIGSPIDKPKKNLKKYLYKKQGAAGDLPLPLKSKTSSYPAPSTKLRGEKSLPPIVVITGSSDDEPAGSSEGAPKTEGIYNFFNKISRAFARDGKGEHDMEHGDMHGNDKLNPFGSQKPTAFPSAPLPPDYPMNDDQGQSGERDDEDSGSEEEDNEEDDNGDEPDNEDEQDDDNNDNEEPADDLVNIDGILPAKVKKNKKPKDPEPISQESDTAQVSSENEKKPVGKDKEGSKEKGEEEQEEESEEEEENDQDEPDLPDNVPPFIRQAMIEDHKRKQQEKAQGGAGGRPGGAQQGGPGQQGPGGQPGQGQGYGQGPQQQYGRPPQKTGGFLSSFFS